MHSVARFSALAGLIVLAGCLSPVPNAPDEPSPRLLKARGLYESGQLTQAMLECVDLARIDPDMPGLANLQRDVSRAIWARRAQDAEARSANTYAQMAADLEAHKVVPDTYGLRRMIAGQKGPLRTQPTEMERALERKVTLHVDGATLGQIILQLGADEKINIIADQVDDTKTVTVHADKVPLREILDYVSRNLGVTFSVGQTMIWATAEAPAGSKLPMETRVYRLRKGLSSKEVEGGGDTLDVVQAIQKFVPAVDGADWFFSDKAHVLIAKNTRENLSRIEDMIEALDIVPPQVLIEARFISTSVTDLRELGIDWVLNSAAGVTTKQVVRNGQVVSVNSTEVASGASIDMGSFPNEATGLNMTYQGILTDPMFTAVLHALETSGKSRTLSAPRVTTVNNRPAFIRVGEDFRYFEEYDTVEILSGTTDEGREIYTSKQVPVGTPTLEELGIQLNVTPSVGADAESISLLLTPEIKDFVRWEYWEVANDDRSNLNNNDNNNTTDTTNTTGTSTIKLPVFRTSRIETEVIVRSGETVIMGGLIVSTESRNVSGVPILSAMPLIGKLFQHESVDNSARNLLIFVTATILSERGESLVPLAAPAGAPPAALAPPADGATVAPTLAPPAEEQP